MLINSASSGWRMSADATEHAFRIVGRDGRTAIELAAGFTRGITEALDAGAPAGRRLESITDLGARSTARDEAELLIRLAMPDRRTAHKLAHPSFAAEGTSGPWEWEERHARCGLLIERQGPARHAPLELEYRVIDDPDAGLEAYERGEVDATSPVLHSPGVLTRLIGRPDLVETCSNTFLVLFPVSAVALQPNVRQALRVRLDLGALSRQLTPSLSPVGGFSRFSEAHERLYLPTPDARRPTAPCRPLTIAYDPFPPNRQVLEVVCGAWDGEVTLVADDFVSPSVLCDFRLVVLVNSHAYEADAYRMVGNTAAVKSESELYDRWWRQIAAYDSASDDRGRTSAIRALDELLTATCPAILLARLNAFHLRRPALAWLNFASDVSWERNS
jgi:hypothetical protein